MINKIMFSLKYKSYKIMRNPQFNHSCIYTSKLDYKELNKLMRVGNESDEVLSDSSASMFKLVGEHEIFTRLASCMIKPRFFSWKIKNANKYCRDIEKYLDVNDVSKKVADFFLSNPLLPNSLAISFFKINLGK